MFITRIVCCIAACCMLRWIFIDIVSGWMGGRGWPRPDSRWLFSLIVPGSRQVLMGLNLHFQIITTVVNRNTRSCLKSPTCLVQDKLIPGNEGKYSGFSWDFPCPHLIHSHHHDFYWLHWNSVIHSHQLEAFQSKESKFTNTLKSVDRKQYPA